MRVSITCENKAAYDGVYTLLTGRTQNTGCLDSPKTCLDKHVQLNNILEFNLTSEEINAVRSLPGVVSVVTLDNTITTHSFKKVKSYPGRVAIGSNSPQNLAGPYYPLPHHMYYCQTYERRNDIIGTGNNQFVYEPTSVDCSNVDIIVIGTVNQYHHDFYHTDGKTSRVKDFPWEDLANALGESSIITTDIRKTFLAPNGSKDDHGTNIASLAAGNYCGYAKRASIYPVGIDAGGTYNHYKLIIQFIQAKAKNLFGLNSSRPTIVLSTVGYEQNGFLAHETVYNNGGSSNDRSFLVKNFLRKGTDHDTNVLYQSLLTGVSGTAITQTAVSRSNQLGMSKYADSKAPGYDPIADSYVKLITQTGTHIVQSAGNDNWYLTKSQHVIADVLKWGLGAGSTTTLLTAFSPPSWSTSTNNTVYTSILNAHMLSAYATYMNVGGIPLSASGPGTASLFINGEQSKSWLVPVRNETWPVTYTSPRIGLTNKPAEDENDLINTVIVVGCVTPVYFNGPMGYSWYHAGAGHMAHVFFNNKDNLATFSVAATSLDVQHPSVLDPNGPKFIKSPYSNWGPGVDIYAPGNGTYAATLSGLLWYPIRDNLITITSPVTGHRDKNIYMKPVVGTSAAAGIVAGILATYLASFPTATPGEAKLWLMGNGMRGAIFQTNKVTEKVKMNWKHMTSSGTLSTQTVYNAPIGVDRTKLTQYAGYPVWWGCDLSTPKWVTPDAPGDSFVDKYTTPAYVHNFLQAVRFFDSNNIIAQAYPLRRAILPLKQTKVNFSGKIILDLESEQPNTLRPTHRVVTTSV